MDLFRDVDTDWSANPNIYAGLSSGEGFIKMVRDAVTRRNKDGELVDVARRRRQPRSTEAVIDREREG